MMLRLIKIGTKCIFGSSFFSKKYPSYCTASAEKSYGLNIEGWIHFKKKERKERITLSLIPKEMNDITFAKERQNPDAQKIRKKKVGKKKIFKSKQSAAAAVNPHWLQFKT